MSLPACSSSSCFKAKTEKASVLELGCGSGAFLFPLNELVKASYFGLDYSPSLINIAKIALPKAHLVATEAKSSVFDANSLRLP